MEDRIRVIAIADYVHYPYQSEHADWAKLIPLFFDRNGEWIKVVSPVESFPSEGLVFWWQPPAGLRRGSLWVVEVDEHPQYGAPHKNEKYQVDKRFECSQLVQVISLPNVDNRTALRRSLVAGEIRLPYPTSGPTFIKDPEADDNWIGPVDVEIKDNTPSLEAEIKTENKGFLPVASFDAINLIPVEFEGYSGSFIHRDTENVSTKGYFNTQSDSELIRSLLKRIRKIDTAVWESIGVTQKVYDNYISVLEGADLTNDKRMMGAARREAAKVLLEDIEGQAKFLQSTLDEIVKSEKIAGSLDEKIEEYISKRKEEIKQEFEAEKIRNENEIRSKLEQSQSKLDDIEKEYAQIKTKVDKVVSGLPSVVNKIVSEGAEAISQDVILSKLIQTSGGGRTSDVENIKPSQIFNRKLLVCPDVHAIIKELQKRAYVEEFDPLISKCVLGCLAGGRIALLGGVLSETLATMVADAFAGHNSVRVSISPTVFSLHDLLSSPCTPIGFEFDKTVSLGEYLDTLGDKEYPSVVVLSGINRVPPENILPDLLEALAPHSLSSCLTYECCAKRQRVFSLSPNTNFLLTLTPGEGAYNLSSDLGKQIPFVHSDGLPINTQPLELDELNPTTLNYTIWSEVTSCSAADINECRSELGGCVMETCTPFRLMKYCSRFASVFHEAKVGRVFALLSLLLGGASSEPLTSLANDLDEPLGDKLREIVTSVSGTHYENLFSK